MTVASFIASQRAGYGVANAVAWGALDVSESWSLASGGIAARPGGTSGQRRPTRRCASLSRTVGALMGL